MKISIKDFESYYIYSDGRVFSTKSNRFLKQFNKAGYNKVTLVNSFGRKHLYVHRLVAEGFLPNPNEYNSVDHIDRNKRNNHFLNLQWMDIKENIHKEKKSGLPMGVEKHHNKYQARRQIDGKKYVSQNYNTPEEAYEMYVMWGNEE